MIIDGFPDRKITVQDKEYLYFGGTSYLGIASHPEFQQLLYENIKKWGTFYGSSRNANVALRIYEEAEQQFAVTLGAEASLTVSSGTLAGKLALAQLSKETTCFFHYPKSHPAIIAPESNPLFLNGALNPRLCTSVKEKVVITADAILGLEVKPTNFDFLESISPTKTVTLLVDESHSLGVVGSKGEGVFNTINTKNVARKILIASLGKGLGLAGGIIAGDTHFIEALRQEPSFVSASGMSPAYLATYIAGSKIYEEQREKLNSNLELINSKWMMRAGYLFDKEYPVIYSNDAAIFTTLLENGIVITSFAYPTYKKTM